MNREFFFFYMKELFIFVHTANQFLPLLTVIGLLQDFWSCSKVVTYLSGT